MQCAENGEQSDCRQGPCHARVFVVGGSVTLVWGQKVRVNVEMTGTKDRGLEMYERNP